MTTATPKQTKLSFNTKFFYGVGALSGEIDGAITGFFFLFFLTNIVGLSPTLAGSVLLIGRVWDGITDPIIGWLSDRTVISEGFSRFPFFWGRRYPWMIFGAIPFGIFFMLQWVIPPLTNQWLLFTYYTVILLLGDTALTSVLLPYSALAAELTQDYNEKTSLMSFKSAFTIGGSLFSLVLAQAIFSLISHQRDKYFILGVVGGLVIILAVYISILGTFPQYREILLEKFSSHPPSATNFWTQMRLLLRNKPFLIVVAIILCTGLASNVTAGILAYFVSFNMKLPDQHITQLPLVVQGSALTLLYIWNAVGQSIGKKAILFLGIPIWIIAELGLFFLQPGQIGLMYLYAVMAGVGLSSAILVPWAMLPDVIDLDELQTGQRREGILYGLVVLVYKLGTAIAFFLVGKILDFSGFLSHSPGEKIPIQPDSALWAIQLIIAPLPALTLIITLLLTYFYPITREIHGEILVKLRESKIADKGSEG